MSYTTVAGDIIELGEEKDLKCKEKKFDEESVFYIDTDTKVREECFGQFIKRQLLGSGAFSNVYSSCKKDTDDCKYVMKISDISYIGEQRVYLEEVEILKQLNTNKWNIQIAPYMYDNWICKENKKHYGIILSEKMDSDLTNLINIRIDDISIINKNKSSC